MTVQAHQFRIFEVRSIRVVETEQHQRKPNKEHDDRGNNVSQVGIEQTHEIGYAESKEHNGDRARHPPPEAALASCAFRCVFAYGHCLDDAIRSVGERLESPSRVSRSV